MKDDQYFSEQDELFGEYLRRHLVQSHPNPDRIGCPDPRIMRDIAFRRQVAPETIKMVSSHMFKCSECARDALDYVKEYEDFMQTTEE